MNRSETIKAISSALGKLKDVTVYLFGSSARGDYNDNSDIDLLILLPDYLTSRQRVEMESEVCGLLLPIEIESSFEISPIILQHKVWNQRKTPFTINVTNERILI